MRGVLFVLCLVWLPVLWAQPAVVTRFGTISGTSCGSGSNQYLGIPFAEPPVGALRWRAPVPWTKSFANGVLNAIQPGAQCVQFASTASSEDCLFLNVYVPSAPAPISGWPVMVFIHGGSFVGGNGTRYLNNGCFLSAQRSTIMVSMNYRLGPFGFLARQDLLLEDPNSFSTGNYGIQDQRLALQWVKENIYAFGGDSKRTLLFGASAGAISTLVHLVSPKSAGLFSSVLSQSGSGDSAFVPLNSALTVGGYLAQTVGCTDPTTALQCLRSKDAKTILYAVPPTDPLIPGPGAVFGPVIGTTELPKTPYQMVQNGQFNRVPVVLGTTLEEGKDFTLYSFPDMASVTRGDVKKFLRVLYSRVQTRKILRQYPVSKYQNSYWNVASKLFGEVIFTCPTRRMATALSLANAVVYKYLWSHYPKCSVDLSLVSNELAQTVGPMHTSEYPFVFGVYDVNQNCSMSSEERTLSSWVGTYWSTFAATGSPNSALSPLQWPKYEFATNKTLELTLPRVQILDKIDQKICDFWDTLPPALLVPIFP